MPACRAPIVVILLAIGTALTTAACTDSGPEPASSATAPQPLDARTRLAGLAAAAQDRHFSARYALSRPDRPDRSVRVVLASDGSWRLDVPGGAPGDETDIAVAGNRDGLYRCLLDDSDPSCVQVSGADGALPPSVDPRVQHPFTDWLDVLTDRRAALSVETAPTLPGAGGTCFSVEPTAAALLAPIDAGVYCFDSDGTLTGVRAGFGTLVLDTALSPAPSTAVLPGPVTGNTPPPPVARGSVLSRP